LLLCLALAACGDSAEDDYGQRFPPIDRALVALAEDVAEGLRQADDATLAQRFDGYARRLGRLRARLDELDPPGSLEREHRRLLAATAVEREQLVGVAEAARRGDAAAAGAAATGVVHAGARLDQARARLASELGG
jgi:hypothetical protein